MTTTTQNKIQRERVFPNIKYFGEGLSSVRITLTLTYDKPVNSGRDIDLNPCRTVTAVSLVGEIGPKHNPHSCGQIQDTLREFYTPKAYPNESRLLDLWERWHLNDMIGGERSQRAFIEKYQKKNPDWRYDYTHACVILKDADLYEVRGYKYGHAWLAEPLPLSVETELLNFFPKEE